MLGKTGVPGEKPFGAEKRTNNKFNPHISSSPRIDPEPHRWEASAPVSFCIQRPELKLHSALPNCVKWISFYFRKEKHRQHFTELLFSLLLPVVICSLSPDIGGLQDLSWTNTLTEEKMTLTFSIPAYGQWTFCLVHTHGPTERKLAIPIPKSRFTCDRPIVSNDVQATYREDYMGTLLRQICNDADD